jgi:hypothetical protein
MLGYLTPDLLHIIGITDFEASFFIESKRSVNEKAQ